MKWGKDFGKEIYDLAIKMFSLVCSSAAAERNWSSHDFFISKRRNRLSTEKSTKLVSIYCNGRIIEKVVQEDTEPYDPSLSEPMQDYMAAFTEYNTPDTSYIHPTTEFLAQVLRTDTAVVDLYEGMHEEEMGNDLSLGEERACDNANDEPNTEDITGGHDVDDDGLHPEYISEIYDILECPANVPGDVEEGSLCAIYFGEPDNRWFEGVFAGINKKKKKQLNAEVKFDIDDTTTPLLIVKETYGSNKTWILLKEKDLIVVAPSISSDSEEDLSD
jgi:hypothetical protein